MTALTLVIITYLTRVSILSILSNLETLDHKTGSNMNDWKWERTVSMIIVNKIFILKQVLFFTLRRNHFELSFSTLNKQNEILSSEC